MLFKANCQQCFDKLKIRGKVSRKYLIIIIIFFFTKIFFFFCQFWTHSVIHGWKAWKQEKFMVQSEKKNWAAIWGTEFC